MEIAKIHTVHVQTHIIYNTENMSPLTMIDTRPTSWEA